MWYNLDRDYTAAAVPAGRIKRRNGAVEDSDKAADRIFYHHRRTDFSYVCNIHEPECVSDAGVSRNL